MTNRADADPDNTCGLRQWVAQWNAMAHNDATVRNQLLDVLYNDPKNVWPVLARLQKDNGKDSESECAKIFLEGNILHLVCKAPISQEDAPLLWTWLQEKVRPHMPAADNDVIWAQRFLFSFSGLRQSTLTPIQNNILRWVAESCHTFQDNDRHAWLEQMCAVDLDEWPQTVRSCCVALCATAQNVRSDLAELVFERAWRHRAEDVCAAALAKTKSPRFVLAAVAEHDDLTREHMVWLVECAQQKPDFFHALTAYIQTTPQRHPFHWVCQENFAAVRPVPADLSDASATFPARTMRCWQELAVLGWASCMRNISDHAREYVLHSMVRTNDDALFLVGTWTENHNTVAVEWALNSTWGQHFRDEHGNTLSHLLAAAYVATIHGVDEHQNMLQLLFTHAAAHMGLPNSFGHTPVRMMVEYLPDLAAVALGCIAQHQHHMLAQATTAPSLSSKPRKM